MNKFISKPRQPRPARRSLHPNQRELTGDMQVLDVLERILGTSEMPGLSDIERIRALLEAGHAHERWKQTIPMPPRGAGKSVFYAMNAVAHDQFQATQNMFAELVSKYSVAAQLAHADIRKGFPVSVLQDTSKYFELSAGKIRQIVGVPSTTAHTWSRQGANMDPAASERIWRMADVNAQAVDVFGSAEAAKSWLTAPNQALDGSTPLEYLDSEPGAIAVRQILNAIATGGAV